MCCLVDVNTKLLQIRNEMKCTLGRICCSAFRDEVLKRFKTFSKTYQRPSSVVVENDRNLLNDNKRHWIGVMQRNSNIFKNSNTFFERNGCRARPNESLCTRRGLITSSKTISITRNTRTRSCLCADVEKGVTTTGLSIVNHWSIRFAPGAVRTAETRSCKCGQCCSRGSRHDTSNRGLSFARLPTLPISARI